MPLSFAPLCLTFLALTGPLAEPPPVAPGAVGEADAARLRAYGADTWQSLARAVGPSGLPADGLHRVSRDVWEPAGSTSPTDIAAYLWSVPAAEALGLIDPREAHGLIDRTLAALEGMRRADGFFYNWYDPVTAAPLTSWPSDGTPVRPFLSSVDNAWLAVALMIVSRAKPELAPRAEALLRPMDFGFFYDAYDPAAPTEHPGQFRVGHWPDSQAVTPSHYGLLNTEARIISYVALTLGQVPREHYFRLQRVLPPGLDWQEQVPAGREETYLGVNVFEGHYAVGGMRVVPSWGGSMFEALMVTLFVPEAEWGPASWGVNHPLYVRAQIEFGRAQADHGLWGFSPSSRPGGGYQEYGVPALGTKPGGYPAQDQGGPGAPRPPGFVVTPHASFLALPFAPREALANLAALAERFPSYGPFGFSDAVNVSTGRVADCVLTLDQGMCLAAVANALDQGLMQRLFAAGPVEAAIRPLLASERFTAGVGPGLDDALPAAATGREGARAR